MSVLRGVLGAAHGADAAGALSWFSITEEIEHTTRGLEVVVSDEAWVPSRTMSSANVAAILLALARRVPIRRHLEAPTRRRSPESNQTPRIKHKDRTHVSTFRILNDLPQKTS